MCVIAHKVLPLNFFMNRLFMITANMTFPYGAEFPRDTTKVFQLYGNKPSSKHARVSSSSERPAIDNYAIIYSKSFRCLTIDWPSLRFNSLASASRKSLLARSLCHTCFPSSSKECVDLSLWQHDCKD